jgi:hypothetical protein
MPESFNVGVGAGHGHGRNPKKDKTRKRFEKRITLKMLLDWIEQQNYDDYTKQELLKRASAYPYGGYKYFAETITQQIISIREERDKLRKERNERSKPGAEPNRANSERQRIVLETATDQGAGAESKTDQEEGHS